MALVLTRSTGQTLMIGDDIEVIVLGVKGNQVRIGITAPEDVDIHRREIWQKIQDQKAANADTQSLLEAHKARVQLGTMEEA